MPEFDITVIASSYQAGDDKSSRAEMAAKDVMNNLMEQSSYINKQAKSCLMNIKAGVDMTFEEFTEISRILWQEIGEDTTVVVGTSLDMDLQGILVSTAVII
ncbi:hypothetical protein [Rodentibacter pneumotropicus]|uniref:Cell division protein FtsZ n=1 Tax=Rodentibacter pneumotropicus TaxID=758 RepID=A0A3S4U801_9PAST|nr:hypothetical protein [Rodentibacter pneumotropicus]VEH67454.1 Cell division protein FtsZ [Rodentibacter pneumotropicus]